MIRGLIFDFDGLILDTEVPEYQAWQEIYREHGSDLPQAVWASSIGTTPGAFNAYDYLETQLGRSIDRSAIRVRRKQRDLELIAMQPIMPGVKEIISEAKRAGLKLAVASSSSNEWVTSHLARLGLHAHFECVQCADAAIPAKPDPSLYQRALSALQIHADEAIAFEDSPNGITAAKRSGIFCIAVPNAMTRALALDHADMRLDSLADVSLNELLLKVAQHKLERTTSQIIRSNDAELE